jgi:pyroglutamyl-peptidase
MGQAPGAAAIRLEKIALNVACEPEMRGDLPLCHDGPLAYQSSLPLHAWAEAIRAAGIPAEVSYHAGTYLCNAALYFTHYFGQLMQLKTQAAFIHLPLDPSQVGDLTPDAVALPAAISAAAIRTILATLD